MGGADASLTVDLGIVHQQPPLGRRIRIVVLRARTNQVEDLLPLVPSVLKALDDMQPGEIRAIA
jgi:hypothetical protein